jgi:hypothetical protein
MSDVISLVKNSNGCSIVSVGGRLQVFFAGCTQQAPLGDASP